MTFAEDRVLVGVVNRKRDLESLRTEHWYRIPQLSMARGIQAEYMAFFLSRAFGEQNGGIHYYARINGVELNYRRFIAKDEPDHPRADDLYYRIALGAIETKTPPILNNTHRTIAFIYTTWDRFVQARTISDLYSKADYLVDRVYYALRKEGIHAQRFWDAESKQTAYAPGLRVMSASGAVYASMGRTEEALYVDWQLSEQAIVAAIQAELKRRGGLVDVNVPLEGF